MKERDHLKDAGVDGRILKCYLHETEWEDRNWINMAQDRDK
jgi:hypothetical protein